MKDLKADIARRRPAATGTDESRVGDSNSNATAEVAVQEVENMTRTRRSSLEARLQGKIRLDHPIVPWLIKHAAANITRFKVRASGKTAFQLMKGFKGVMPVGIFGEAIYCRIPKATEAVGKYEDRWIDGVYLGFDMRSGEYLVGSETGVHRTGAERRKPADERWSRELIDKVCGDPEDHTKRPATLARKEGDAQPAIVPPTLLVTEAPEPQVRAFRITRKDWEEYGSTEGCAGCRALRDGTESRNHSKTCRDRFEELLGDTSAGQERIGKAAKIITEAVARAGEKAAGKEKESRATGRKTRS